MASKIMDQLLDLSASEKRKFLSFAASPYLNKHEKTLELVSLILEREDARSITEDPPYLFSLIFPNTPFQEQLLHNLLSYLKKLYHKFIALEQLNIQNYTEELNALEYSYTHNQWDFFNNRSKALSKMLSNTSSKDPNYHFTNYKLNSLLGYHQSAFYDRTKTVHFQAMMDHLDLFFLQEKLKHSCHLKANMDIANTQYELRLLDQIITFLESEDSHYLDDPIIKLYYTIYKTMEKELSEPYYLKLQEILATDLSNYPYEATQDLYTFSYNYCIRQINAGNEDFKRELFQLYQKGLNNGLLLENDILSEWDYKNITTLGCNLEEFDWTLTFIENFKNHLPSNRQENAYNFALGLWNFSKGRFDDALNALQLVQYTDVKYHISTTFLTIRTFYEKQDTEALMSLLETFRIYVIRNKKIPTIEKRGYSNFVRFTKHLVNLVHQPYAYSSQEFQKKLTQLQTNIENTAELINKNWLLSEILKQN